MAMNRKSQDIAAFIKNILCPVPMVKVNIQYGDFPKSAEIMAGDCRIVKIAESSEYPPLGMMAGRTAKGIGQSFPLKNLLGCRQRYVHRGAGGIKRIAIQRSEGINAVITRTYGQIFRAAIRSADRKNIWIHRLLTVQFLTDGLQIVKKF